MCKLDCDEMYCETCYANNTNESAKIKELAEINLMFAKKRYEDAVEQTEEIRTLLVNAISLETETLREYQLALEKQSEGVL